MNIKEIIDDVINNYINEESFYNYRISNILTDKRVREFIKDNPDDIQMYLDYHIEQYDLEDVDPNKIKYSPEFIDSIYNQLYHNITTAYDLIDDRINDNKIKLYRKMTVDDNWLNHLATQGKRLGIYWTFEKGSAETYWGDSNKRNTALIEIEINQNYINWNETFNQLMSPNYFEEMEIRLYKNTPLQILSIEINDEPVNISTIQNKTFYA